MDNILARDLIHAHSVPGVEDSFTKYIDFRISTLHNYLEQADSLSQINKIQGKIEELRKLRGLKQECAAILNKGTQNG